MLIILNDNNIKSIIFLVILILIFVGLFLFIIKIYGRKSKKTGNKDCRKIDSQDLSLTNDNVDFLRDFLLAKFGHFSKLLSENEILGEKRVTLFFTLLTSLTGAIGLSTIIGNNFYSDIFELIKSKSFLLIISFLSTTLLLFGLVTLKRIIKRNVITDDYKVELDKINKIFGITNLEPINLREKGIIESLFLGNGGYLETMKLLNSLILGLICSVILIYLTQSFNLFMLLVFLIGAGGGWINQSFYSKISYHKEEKDKKDKNRALENT